MDQKRHPQYLDIHLGATRKWRGLIAYAAFFIAVCAILVWFFIFFTHSVSLAIGAVAIMVSYMAIMGYLASRNIQKKDPGM